MNEVKFSIIIPVYNASKYIDVCLASVLAQKYKNYEIIIVDDGSSDNTVSIVNRIAAGESRIRIIENEHGGVCKARNTGIDIANGDYICMVDADDAVFDDYLQSIYEAISETKADVVYFYTKYGIDSRKRNDYQGEKLYRLDKATLDFLSLAAIYHTPEIDNANSRLHGISSFSAGGQCYRADLYRKNNCRYEEGLTLSEDGLMNMELLHYASSGVIIRKELYNYRTDNISATRSYKPDLIAMFNKRNRSVKRLIEKFGINESLYSEIYDGCQIYQLRIIAQNCIFAKDNPASEREKEKLFDETINMPDYAHALSVSDSIYLEQREAEFCEIVKKGNPESVRKFYAAKDRRNLLKRTVKRALKVIGLYG